MTKPIWEALVAGAKYSHERLLEIWDDVRPDVVCTDNVTGYPAVELAGAPWARFVSANRDEPPEGGSAGETGDEPGDEKEITGGEPRGEIHAPTGEDGTIDA